MCCKDRLIELLHDFILFDAGIKKVPRVHQNFGIKAAQEEVRQRKSGIIWHTQGSGKSLVMVFLAKWILENNPNARVAIMTDRDELDKQIEGVFTEAGESISRTSSGRDLMSQLAQGFSALCRALEFPDPPGISGWSGSMGGGPSGLIDLSRIPLHQPRADVPECFALLG